ncbi:hypothetical protein HYH02_014663 [Chlamydomonas schloesseri]|uniref:Uncharacterized protein n=1 Tax=Chlamydomonas schloesseri TaxID=2026947 RepID=A0A835VRY1_9CHLO|nr:hypothetical protein HYH02_014663 [Chlamydomonas schloesseri]|eukprot:KAG2427017.1 hypothetical protein HYH02_014663 [Chlamydomonas schloesseri]
MRQLPGVAGAGALGSVADSDEFGGATAAHVEALRLRQAQHQLSLGALQALSAWQAPLAMSQSQWGAAIGSSSGDVHRHAHSHTDAGGHGPRDLDASTGSGYGRGGGAASGRSGSAKAYGQGLGQSQPGQGRVQAPGVVGPDRLLRTAAAAAAAAAAADEASNQAAQLLAAGRLAHRAEVEQLLHFAGGGGGGGAASAAAGRGLEGEPGPPVHVLGLGPGMAPGPSLHASAPLPGAHGRGGQALGVAAAAAAVAALLGRESRLTSNAALGAAADASDGGRPQHGAAALAAALLRTWEPGPGGVAGLGADGVGSPRPGEDRQEDTLLARCHALAALMANAAAGPVAQPAGRSHGLRAGTSGADLDALRAALGGQLQPPPSALQQFCGAGTSAAGGRSAAAAASARAQAAEIEGLLGRLRCVQSSGSGSAADRDALVMEAARQVLFASGGPQGAADLDAEELMAAAAVGTARRIGGGGAGGGGGGGTVPLPGGLLPLMPSESGADWALRRQQQTLGTEGSLNSLVASPASTSRQGGSAAAGEPAGAPQQQPQRRGSGGVAFGSKGDSVAAAAGSAVAMGKDSQAANDQSQNMEQQAFSRAAAGSGPVSDALASAAEGAASRKRPREGVPDRAAELLASLAPLLATRQHPQLQIQDKVAGGSGGGGGGDMTQEQLLLLLGLGRQQHGKQQRHEQQQQQQQEQEQEHRRTAQSIKPEGQQQDDERSALPGPAAGPLLPDSPPPPVPSTRALGAPAASAALSGLLETVASNPSLAMQPSQGTLLLASRALPDAAAAGAAASDSTDNDALRAEEGSRLPLRSQAPQEAVTAAAAALLQEPPTNGGTVGAGAGGSGGSALLPPVGCLQRGGSVGPSSGATTGSGGGGSGGGQGEDDEDSGSDYDDDMTDSEGSGMDGSPPPRGRGGRGRGRRVSGGGAADLGQDALLLDPQMASVLQGMSPGAAAAALAAAPRLLSKGSRGRRTSTGGGMPLTQEQKKVTMAALQAKVSEQEARIKKLEERLSRYEPV